MQYLALVPKMGAVGGGSSGNSVFRSRGQIALLPVLVLHFCLKRGQAGRNRGFSRKSAVLLWGSSSPSGIQGSVLTDLVFPTALVYSVGCASTCAHSLSPSKMASMERLGVSSGPGQLCFLSVRLSFVTGLTWHTGPGALRTPHSTRT